MAQVFIIHGGDSFKTRKEYLSFLESYKIDLKRYKTPEKGWKANLYKYLGRDFEVFLPAMPNKINAKYSEWSLWFEKVIPHIKPGVILIGHSLGGLFLAKYLSENKFPKKILATFLIAAPIGEGDFITPKTFKRFEKQGGQIFLYQSGDDRVVSFGDFKKYHTNLPSATARTFKHEGHFNGAQIPQLVKDIKSLK